MTLTLYGLDFSNNAFRALFYLKEKGLEFKFESVDLLKGANKQEEYTRLNPRGQVPCLLDGDIPVYESVAIIQYLELKHTSPALYPASDRDRALCLTRVHEFQQKLDQKNVVGSVIFRKHGLAELGERVDTLMNELKTWDGYLEGKEYLANTFSIADIVVFPFMAPYYEVLGLSKDKFPALSAWYERVKARDSIKEDTFFSSLKEVGLAKNPDAAVLATIK